MFLTMEMGRKQEKPEGRDEDQLQCDVSAKLDDKSIIAAVSNHKLHSHATLRRELHPAKGPHTLLLLWDLTLSEHVAHTWELFKGSAPHEWKKFQQDRGRDGCGQPASSLAFLPPCMSCACSLCLVVSVLVRHRR